MTELSPPAAQACLNASALPAAFGRIEAAMVAAGGPYLTGSVLTTWSTPQNLATARTLLQAGDAGRGRGHRRGGGRSRGRQKITYRTGEGWRGRHAA